MNRLKTAGEALYGPRWQTQLARDLGVADRTIRRWLSGSNDVPFDVWSEIINLLVERGERIDAALIDLLAFTDKQLDS